MNADSHAFNGIPNGIETGAQKGNLISDPITIDDENDIPTQVYFPNNIEVLILKF